MFLLLLKKWTTNGVVYKSGLSGLTCSSLPSGYLCCSTNLCNGAKINGISILMISAATVFALLRTI